MEKKNCYAIVTMDDIVLTVKMQMTFSLLH